MPITVQEINEKEFGETAFHNYKGYDVDTFLDYVADEVEVLLNTNREQGERLAQFEAQVLSIRQMEAELRQALESAKSSYEEIIRTAQNKAARIIADAQKQAAEITGSVPELAPVAPAAPVAPVAPAAPVAAAPAEAPALTVDEAREKLAQYAAQLMSQVKA